MTVVTTPCVRLAIRIFSSCVPIDAPLAVQNVSSEWALLTVKATSAKGVDKDAVGKKKKLAGQVLLGEDGQYLRLRARL